MFIGTLLFEEEVGEGRTREGCDIGGVFAYGDTI